MALPIGKQIEELINKSNNILITFPADYTTDSVASALALSSFLKLKKKEHDIVCASSKLNKNLKFLENLTDIKSEIEALDKLVIKLDVAKVKVKEFAYDIKDGFLNIYISPEKGSFKAEDVKAQTASFKYDLIITLDSHDLKSLGAIFYSHSEFFYKIPVINIDHNAENEHYGQVNNIDLSACSISEILYKTFLETSPEILTKSVCTALLAGIISKTNSFKNEYVTPQCLQAASDLISKGGNKEIIIKHLYQQKSIDTLKVWGKILSNLRHDDSRSIFYSSLTKADLIDVRINATDIIEIIDHLLVSIPNADVVLLGYPGQNNITFVLWTNKKYNSLELTKSLNSRGTKDLAHFSMKDANLPQALQRIIVDVKAKMKGDTQNKGINSSENQNLIIKKKVNIKIV